MFSLKFEVTDLPKEHCIKTKMTPVTMEGANDKELSYIATVMTMINDMINDKEGQEYLIQHYGEAIAERYVELKTLVMLAGAIGLKDFSDLDTEAMKDVLRKSGKLADFDKPVI